MEGEGVVGEIQRTIRRMDLDFERATDSQDCSTGEWEGERSTRWLGVLFGATCDTRSRRRGGFLLVQIDCFWFILWSLSMVIN